MKLISALVILAAASQCLALFTKDLDHHWASFKAIHGKIYQPEEDQMRKTIFEQNVEKIVRHNLEYDLGLHSYRLGLNKYADLSEHEVSKYLNGLIQSFDQKKDFYVPSEDMEIPSSLDWRTKGYVTPVKDQKSCGSCWAFSTTGTLEGQMYKKTGKLVSLSERNLVDCALEDWLGCLGGTQEKALDYVIKNGIDTEESYPYNSHFYQKCSFNKTTIGATCKSYKSIPQNETILQQSLAAVGPLAICMDSKHKSFHLYKSGIYEEPKCSSTKLTHAILLVGYGTENGKDYWLVKNSWGTHWGEDGYFKIARNKNNMCGIATEALFPIV